jgi:hypothetical protein
MINALDETIKALLRRDLPPTLAEQGKSALEPQTINFRRSRSPSLLSIFFFMTCGRILSSAATRFMSSGAVMVPRHERGRLYAWIFLFNHRLAECERTRSGRG